MKFFNAIAGQGASFSSNALRRRCILIGPENGWDATKTPLHCAGSLLSVEASKS
ncbi:MAG: hypothetical protein GX799_08200 [Crenarchaeota archaeon]|nr:hypothetical protein [Thermoproteota archaeon]